MIEMAVAYLGAYFGRKALGVVAQAGSDIDAAIDGKLDQLYNWVKGKLTGQGSGDTSLEMLKEKPEGENQQKLVGEQLTEALAGDAEATAQLQALVDELDKLWPEGVTIRGLAKAEGLHGTQIGADVEGPLPEGSDVHGEAEATTVHKDAQNTGVKYSSPSPVRSTSPRVPRN